jgi:hypothetical protein
VANGSFRSEISRPHLPSYFDLRIWIMGYRPRYFVSNKLYALCFRTIEGLPFVATSYMKLLLLGIMARAQRDQKVVLCHFIWMGNHAHILAIFKDSDQAKNFYAEVQKKITDSLKSLLGLPHLRLWERRPVVAQVLDLPAAIQQTAYLYANPSRADLVDSISQYPGCSSWDVFQALTRTPEKNTLTTSSTIKTLWIPFSKIPLLPALSLKKHADMDFTAQLAPLGRPHNLELHPNAWMQCFGISYPNEIATTNQKILSLIEEMEEDARKKRLLNNKSVLGERVLRVQNILRQHTPTGRRTRRRVFVICSDKAQRIAYIAKIQQLCCMARICYHDALKGVNRLWPPGMFRPPLRALASALK